tara:strand:- start:142 stop:354 length:213 start_codon:yes stop_codon:yes gene_type:complete
MGVKIILLDFFDLPEELLGEHPDLPVVDPFLDDRPLDSFSFVGSDGVVYEGPIEVGSCNLENPESCDSCG